MDITTEAALADMHPDLFNESEAVAYLRKAREKRDEMLAYDNFWVEAIKAGAIKADQISSYGSRHAMVTVYDWNLDWETTSCIDVEATTVALARFVKWARSKGYQVVKEYGDSTFMLKVEVEGLPDTISVSANRQTVCKKRVVGTEVVPATEREIVEWDCDHVSFLGIDTD